MARFNVYKDRVGEYRWQLKSQNGNIIADSGEGYTRKENAIKYANWVKINAPSAIIYDLTEK